MVVLGVTVLLIVLYLVSVVLQVNGLIVGSTRTQLARIVDLNSEVSVPKWWQVSLMLVASALLAHIAALSRRAKLRDWRWWAALSAVFLYVTVDEAAAIHEVLIRPFQRMIGVFSGPWAAAWVYPVAIILLVAVIVFARFYFRLPRRIRSLFALALLVFVIGAAGFEFLQWATTGAWVLPAPAELSFAGLVVAEELLEVVGVTIFITALLIHLRDALPEHRLVGFAVEPDGRAT
jgi:hypothetical protein